MVKGSKEKEKKRKKQQQVITKRCVGCIVSLQH
jgi:hypothetical protein